MRRRNYTDAKQANYRTSGKTSIEIKRRTLWEQCDRNKRHNEYVTEHCECPAVRIELIHGVANFLTVSKRLSDSESSSLILLHKLVLEGDDTGTEADLGMFSMFGRTGAPQKGGPHKSSMHTNKIEHKCTVSE